MYVRKTTRRYKDKTYTNYLLVESVHTPSGPRQKVVCSLGDLSPRTAEEWLRLVHKVEDALAGQVNLFSSPDPEVEQIVRRVRSRQAGSSTTPAQIVPESTPDCRSRRRSHRSSHSHGTSHRRPGPRRLSVLETVADWTPSSSVWGFSTKAIQLTCAMTLNRLDSIPTASTRCPTGSAPLPWGTSSEWISVPVGRRSLCTETSIASIPIGPSIESALVEQERQLFQLDTTIYLI